MKKIISIIIIILLGLFLYVKYHQENTFIKHSFRKTGYEMSLLYNKDNWNIDQKDFEDKDGYISYIYLEDKQKPREKYISFRYEFLNNGDDTPHEVGDTGGGLWPPQPEELMIDFDENEVVYLGNYLGKELYVDKKPTPVGYAGVYQKLENGKLTGSMPLLGKDKERVNFYDRFTITSHFTRDKETQEKLYKEFLKILKTMKIEKIPNTETKAEQKTTE